MTTGKREEKKAKAVYDEGFKQHIVELYESGQKKGIIAKEYGLHPTSVSNWVNQYHNSGSFKSRDNLSDAEKETKSLKQQLRIQQMEIDILKKAMVVMLKS